MTLSSDPEHRLQEQIFLNRDELIDRLSQLAAAPDIAALRQAVLALSAAIDSPADNLQAHPNDEAVSFTRTYLRDELGQIVAAHTLERAVYYLERLIRAVQEVRTRSINDINLNRWKEYDDIITDSLWLFERRDASGVHSANYWGNFIPQIPHQMMRRYTRSGDWVLDPFAGSGTTLIEGQRLGRNTIGIELQARMVTQARNLISAEPNPGNVICELVQGDALTIDYQALLAQYGQHSIQLVILHPPYFDIIKFSDDPRDLSNATSVDNFIASIDRLVERLAPLLDRGRYLSLIIGDKYTHGEWIPLGFRTMEIVLKHKFTLKSIVVKNFEATAGKRSQTELWRYRALAGGFYIFKHEYLFIFRKQ